jgi:hypothetical protein
MRHEKCSYLEQSLSLLIKNEKVKDPEMVANAFNTFFLSAAENSNLYQVGTCTFIFVKCIS